MLKLSTTTLLAVLTFSNISMAEQSSRQTRLNQKQQVASYYKIAEQAFQAGDKAKTTKALRKALAINPKHGPSYALAIKLKKSGSAFKVKARETQFGSVMLPVVDLQDEPLSEALRILSTLVEEKSNQTVFPNFVIQDKSSTLKDKPITLNMKNVPAKVVLEYLMNMAHASAKFDEYATTIRPLD